MNSSCKPGVLCEDNSEYALRDTFLFKNSQRDSLYQKSLNWLKKDGAWIIEQEKPSYIKAWHRGRYIDAKSVRKEIIIEFKKNNDDVSIEFKILKLPRKAMKIYPYWILLLENYYEFIGVKTDSRILKYLYNIKDLDMMINNAIKGLIVASSFVLLNFYVSIKTHLFFSIFGIGVMYLLIIPILKSYFSYRNKKEIIKINAAHAGT